ncbi:MULTISPECIES: hypothetical protein [Tepidanaerobacter]|uniref:hypothetical protein n=1 Tax=Tepidanaerobacter TaxID=499228 RepID=UPI001BD61409|nr:MULTISPECIES: hypothetical protein [Tepidanaerobacter]
MNNIRRKIFKVVEHELDNIAEHQHSRKNKESKRSPILANFDKTFSKKLKEHDDFMATIRSSMKSTKQ